MEKSKNTKDAQTQTNHGFVTDILVEHYSYHHLKYIDSKIIKLYNTEQMLKLWYEYFNNIR